MKLLLLGPFEVERDGQVLKLGGLRQRALLAFLALHANEVVPVDRLIEELWPGRPPPTAPKIVQNAVVGLRKAVGDRLVTRAPGYMLVLEPDEVDVRRFEALVAEASRQAPAQAAHELRSALSLWRGPPLADFRYESFAQAEIGRLEELRLSALEQRIDADLALARHAELVAELEVLAADNPLRERLREQLMLALYRAGRQAEALDVYRRTRELLVDELGLEPGTALQRLEKAILVQDPALEAPPPPSENGLAVASPRRRRRVALVAGALLAAGAAVVGVLATRGSHRQTVAGNSVAVLDPATGRLLGSVPVGSRPAYLAAGSGAVWVGNLDDSSVSRIDPKTSRTVRTIALPEPPTGLAAGAGSVWISSDSGSVRRIDPAFDAVVQTIRGRRYSFQIDRSLNALSPVAVGAGSVWFGNSSTLTRIDPRAGQAVGSVGVGFSPAGIAVGDGAVWVTDAVDDTVTRVDPSGTTKTIPVGHGASAIAVDRSGVWVADTRDDTVTRIDPQSDAVSSTVRVGAAPSGLAIAAGAIWVANSRSGTISRIDEATGRVKTVAVGGSPNAVAVAEGRVWVGVEESPPPIGSPGGTVRINAPGDLDSIDPAVATDAAAIQLEYATCLKLVNYPDAPAPAGSELRGDGADLPTLSDGGRRYVFRVRSGFRFSPPSDEPVTAETYRRSIVRAMRLNPDAAQMLASVRSIRARGDELEVRLAHRDPSLPARLAAPFFCAVPRRTPFGQQRAQPIPAAGPYFVGSYAPKQSLVLRPNPSYRGPRPNRLSEIDYSFGVDPGRSVREIEAGKADYAVPSFLTGAVPLSDLPGLARTYGPKARPQQLFENPTLEAVWLALNPNRPPFSNAALRRAVGYAVDRPALSRDAAYSFAPDDDLIPPGLAAHRDSVVYPLARPDLRTARRLATGHGAVAIMYTCDGCSEQLTQAELAKIELDVVVREYPAAEMLQRVKTPGEPVDLYVGGTIASYADPAAFINDVIGPYIAALAPRDSELRRRMLAAAALSGPARDRGYERLELWLERRAYLVPLGHGLSIDFFSKRIGCELYQPIYGMDLGALCLRPGR